MPFPAEGTGGVQDHLGIQKAVAGIVAGDALVVDHPELRAFKRLVEIGTDEYELHAKRSTTHLRRRSQPGRFSIMRKRSIQILPSRSPHGSRRTVPHKWALLNRPGLRPQANTRSSMSEMFSWGYLDCRTENDGCRPDPAAASTVKPELEQSRRQDTSR